MQKQQVNVRGTLNSFDQRKEREREITGDSAREISIEDVRHETTRIEGDSDYPRVTGQKSERENGKIVWRNSGIVIGNPIGSAREGSSRTAILDTLEEEGNTQTQLGHKTQGVKRSAVIGPPREPLPERLVNRLSEWKRIGGDKLVSRGIKARWKSPLFPISLEERKHRQEFRGTTEMTSNYLSLLEEELKEGVVNPIQESEVKWFNPTFMVRKKNGKWRKILDCRILNEEVLGKHFKMDSQETVVELLEENDWMTTLDISSAYQHSTLFRRGDAIWSKRHAQSIHEDNETGSVIYQRTLEGKADDISGRHPPHAPRQGCIEIDLTGDSPVTEKSGVDTVGGEAEIRTHKEWGVSGMAVEFREDGSVAPREEESAAPGECANLDSTGKEKETEDEGFCRTPRKVELRETATPASELVDEAHATCAEAGNSPRGREGNGDSQLNNSGRINTLEEGPAREQAKESEEKKQISRTCNGRFRAGMGCSVNNTEREQRGEDLCPQKLDPPGKNISDQREGVQSSIKDTREKVRVVATTEGRSYSSEEGKHVHEMNDTE
ncbi:uncharacterized protein MONOS_2257 [Monocercomonoides exilis]|uniref:uncharacterized protein n=1 Tax=Monocercomonoides exilis TaxID=2049356 RepID=UPI00355A5E8B|nr:hypothetical protein MONOS_2257 [Monocercomonoides exilis]|eukprot:MONOS_2257.1-p1 / transcript=MONOS_2257.1 / gene=MONOS_2257 / organism=Monocercomonoides_exilis_PA203 / gene_product=unspecified product / transcript_product=unspecified product / location=Mono_scaffold00045:128681-130389(+) / protein_length=553 / sequence_SO=supercontig / SO=protein_coding / is_pseudo=false